MSTAPQTEAAQTPADAATPGYVAVQETSAAGVSRWLAFEDPREVLTAGSPEEVLPVLREAQERTLHGLYVAGFVSYEAAAGFDASLQTASTSRSTTNPWPRWGRSWDRAG